MKNRIQEWRKRRYLTMEKLAVLVGTDASTINKLEKGKLRLSDKWMVPLAQVLQIDPGDLIGDPVAPYFEDPRAKESPAAEPARQLPVYGLAAGSLAGQSVMMPEPVEYVACPPGLVNVRDAYVLIVKGTSMVPRYMEGEPQFIHPHKPVRPGDHAVVQVQHRNNGEETLTWVKRFKGEKDDEFIVEQYNPKAEMSFKRTYVRAIHRVLTPNELFGV